MRFFVFLLLLTSCASTPKETPAGKKVKVVKEIKDPYACTQMGKAKYDGTPFIDEAELTIIGKELAAELSGNTVRFDTFEPGVNGARRAKLRATVYKCKKSKKSKNEDKVAPAKAAPPAATPAAEQGEVPTDAELPPPPEG